MSADSLVLLSLKLVVVETISSLLKLWGADEDEDIIEQEKEKPPWWPEVTSRSPKFSAIWDDVSRF